MGCVTGEIRGRKQKMKQRQKEFENISEVPSGIRRVPPTGDGLAAFATGAFI